MKMNNINALNTQFFLNVLRDNEMSSIYLTERNNPNGWQFAVEIIYRLKLCDLVDFDFDVLNKNDKYYDTTYHGLDDFCYNLSITYPNGGELIWINAQMHLTEKGRTLIEYYFKDFDNWDTKINIYFIEKLEQIFEEFHVEWDENNPIFPIKL